jgi:intraflagellar transport protein 56
LEEFLTKRDYSGALSLLDFNRSSNKSSDDVDAWLGYAAFHAGDYKRAMLEFEALTRAKKVS